MKKGLIAVLCVVFSLMFCFTSFGYAALSHTLTVNSTLNVTTPAGLFISKAEVLAGNATIHTCPATALKSTVDLGSDSTSTAILQITVYNNSTDVYAFDQVTYLEEAGTYDNDNIVYALTGLTKGQQLAGGASVTFTITFSYATATVTDTELNSFLNFKFDPYIPGVTDQFQEILNNTTDYNELIDRMDTTSWFNRNDPSYIGNVVGASSADTELLEELFDGKLNLNIGGTETPVTVMIKRENVDGSTSTGDEDGNEMTLYMTADTIGEADVVVYAIVFTKHNSLANAQWIQLGNEMYQGMASTNNYTGGDYYGDPNSFNTSTWRSSFAYNGVAAGATISQIIAALP